MYKRQLICGSILGVQVGQKIGETVDSSQFKTILALLLLLVGIAIAYETFFTEESIVNVMDNGTKTLGPVSHIVKRLSEEVPILYGLFSIVLALVLGVGAAIVRRQLSNLRKKYFPKLIFYYLVFLTLHDFHRFVFCISLVFDG